MIAWVMGLFGVAAPNDHHMGLSNDVVQLSCKFVVLISLVQLLHVIIAELDCIRELLRPPCHLILGLIVPRESCFGSNLQMRLHHVRIGSFGSADAVSIVWEFFSGHHAEAVMLKLHVNT